jgi:hypothetical protein
MQCVKLSDIIPVSGKDITLGAGHPVQRQALHAAGHAKTPSEAAIGKSAIKDSGDIRPFSRAFRLESP